MKRFLTFLAVAASAVLAATSCQDNTTPDVAGPSISWSSNPDFEPQDITDDMDVRISVAAPAGISSFVVTVDSDVLEGLLQTNTIDFINPSGMTVGVVVSEILGEGVSVQGAKELNLDLSALVPLILNATDEESDHIFRLDVTDANGKSATATCTFHRTADTPENPDEPGEDVTETAIAWPGNEDFAPVEIAAGMNATLKVTAVGGIKSFVVKVPESLSDLLIPFGLTTEMDLINNEKVIAALATIAPDMPTGENLKGKTSVDLNISSLLNTMGMLLQAGEYEFVLTVTDSNDEEVSATCTFIKA